MERHRTDVLSLVAGLLFATAGLGRLLGANITAWWVSVWRAWPLLLVVAGVLLLMGIVRRADDT